MASAVAAALPGRWRSIATLVAAMLVLGAMGQAAERASAATDVSAASDLPVGHTVKDMEVGNRQVPVHLWYPAEAQAFSGAGETIYKSALHGKTLIDGLWDPLAWTVSAEVARETEAIEADGPPFPVIVFSHGSTNDPIDYAHTLERIAAGGFVVAAPSHVGNTQDDVRRDFINAEAAKVGGSRLFDCADGRTTGNCTLLNDSAGISASMSDRARDISTVLDKLPAWSGDRVDKKRAGVMGHSRGTVTALAAAGGSTTWGFPREPRIKALMGMAIGAPAIVNGVNLANVTVPAVLVAGKLDTNPAGAYTVSQNACKLGIQSTDKKCPEDYPSLDNATHRTFDSTYCAQLQSAGAAFDTDDDGFVEDEAAPDGGPSEVANPRRILDRHTVGLIAASAPGGLSGKAVHYCASDFFKSPVDITKLVASTPNTEFPPIIRSGSVCRLESIPCTGLDTDTVKEQMAKLAVDFFGHRLSPSPRGPLPRPPVTSDEGAPGEDN